MSGYHVCNLQDVVLITGDEVGVVTTDEELEELVLVTVVLVTVELELEDG